MANAYQRPRRVVRAVRRGTVEVMARTEARKTLAAISRDTLTDRCQTGVDSDIAALQTIINGGPLARNASSRVRAIQLKWGYAYGYPTQQVEGDVRVSLAALLIESMAQERGEGGSGAS